MPWLRIDDGMWRNRKLLDVSPVGKALWTWCLGYSADQLTDGVLARADMRQIAAAVGLDDWQGPMQELVDAGLVERDGDTWLMHDYLDYNPSREQVLKERDAAEARLVNLREKYPIESVDSRRRRKATRRARKANAPRIEQIRRGFIIERDDATCYLCGRRLEDSEITLDHVVALANGGDHTEDNLRVACRPCNSRKGTRRGFGHDLE